MSRFVARLIFVPTLAWNMLLGRLLRVRNWWDDVNEHVVIGALPLASDVAALRSAGVTAVVNTCEEYAGPERAYQEAGITQLRLPTVDFTPPKIEDIERGVAFIESEIGKDGKVYVHCKAGRGRSATIVVCWLIASHDMTPEEAQACLVDKRSHVNKGLANRPVVREFYARHRKHTPEGNAPNP